MIVMSGFWRTSIVMHILLLVHGALFAESNDMQDLYKTIANGLIGIRKDYPASQPKVYSLLDQVEKLYTTAKGAEEKRSKLKDQLRAKVTENVALKTELTALRSEVSTVKKAIETTKNDVDQKLEEERLRVDELLQERKMLQAKLTELEGQKKITDHEKMAENEEEKPLNKSSSRKKDLVALASQRASSSDQPSLRRISTSEPSSPR